MTENNLRTHTGIAALGFLFVIFGIGMLFVFIATLIGVTIPDFLRIDSGDYNYLFIGLVNIASAFGLFYRVKNLWSITVIFMVILIFGSLMNIFFAGTMKYVVAVVYGIAMVYIMSKQGREWYGLQ